MTTGTLLMCGMSCSQFKTEQAMASEVMSIALTRRISLTDGRVFLQNGTLKPVGSARLIAELHMSKVN